MADEFMKFDQEKPNIAIIFDFPLAIEEVARVFMYGAKKYDRGN